MATRSSKANIYNIYINMVDYSAYDQWRKNEAISIYFNVLNDCLENIDQGYSSEVITIGDEVVISLFENNEFDTNLPLNFAKSFLKKCNENSDNDIKFRFRISINYSQNEIMSVEINGKRQMRFQIGEGINIVERINHFCEPNEILISDSYYQQLKDRNKNSNFNRYGIRWKYKDVIYIWSYIPDEDEKYYIHHSNSKNKNLSFFPPVKYLTRNRFQEIKHEDDLYLKSSRAYEMMLSLNEEHIFISKNTIYGSLLTILNSHSNSEIGEIMAVHRADIEPDFWSTPDGQKYKHKLSKKGLDQRRIVVTTKTKHSDDSVEMLGHMNNKYCLYDIKEIPSTSELFKYKLGITIFSELNCAIAPIKLPKGFYHLTTLPREISDTFFTGEFANNDGNNALVIADKDQVIALKKEFNDIYKEFKEPESIQSPPGPISDYSPISEIPPERQLSLLSYYLKLLGEQGKQPFAGKKIIILLDLVSDLILFMDAAIQLGLKPEDTTILYQNCSNPQSSKLIDAFNAKQFKVKPREEYESVLNEMSKNNQEQHPILIIEKDGFLVSKIAQKYQSFDDCNIIGAIEQENINLPISDLPGIILSLANIDIKRKQEPVLLAQAIISSIEKLIPFSLNGVQVAVLGCGDIGLEVVSKLIDKKAIITAYDDNRNNLILAGKKRAKNSNTALEAVKDKQIILGITGKCSINGEVISAIKHDAYLINASLKYDEIDTGELKRRSSMESRMTTGTDYIIDNNRCVHLIANGIPIYLWEENFMSQELADINMTLILLLAAKLSLGENIDEIKSDINYIDARYKISDKKMQLDQH